MEKGVTKYKHFLVALYVDDLLIACSNKNLCTDLEKFSMKILGPISHLLGMDVKVDNAEHIVDLSQQHYIRNTYNNYKEYGIYNYTTPLFWKKSV